MSKSTKLILHIGLPKTGTTSIQNILEFNKQELLNHNIAYISHKSKAPMGDVASLNRYSLEYYDTQSMGRRAYLRSNWKRQELIRRTNKILSHSFNRADTVLISSENLCFYSDDEILKLIGHFNPDSVTIFISIRNISGIIESLYWQSSKIDPPVSLKGFLREALVQATIDHTPYSWLNIQNIISRWQKYGNVKSISLQQNSQIKSDIDFDSVSDLCRYMTSTQIAFKSLGGVDFANKKPAVELPIALNYFKAINGLTYDKSLVKVANSLRHTYQNSGYYLNNETRKAIDDFFESIPVGKKNINSAISETYALIDLNPLKFDHDLVSKCVKEIRKKLNMQRIRDFSFFSWH